MRRRALISVTAVIFIAVISIFIIWRWTVDPDSLGQIGLGSVFVVSLVSHLTIVARDMFVPIYLPLASIYHPLLLGLAAGSGAALGELTIYILGWGVAGSLEDSIGEESRLARWIRRYGLWAVLLVSATPLPDTPLVFLAGSSKLPLGKLLVVEIVGKTALYSIGAVVGGFIFMGLFGAVGGLWASVLMILGSLVFCILITWKKSRDLIFGWFEGLFL